MTREQEAALPQNTRSIMGFLQEHAPFSNMERAHLALFAENAVLAFYADGDIVIGPEDGVITTFNVVKQGRIRGERASPRTGEPETTFEIAQGESFPIAALIGERPTRTLHRAVGDTFCLRLDHDNFIRLFS